MTVGADDVGECVGDIGSSDRVLCGGLLRLGENAWTTCWSVHVTSFFLTVQHDLASPSSLTLVSCSTHRSISHAYHSMDMYRVSNAK